MMIDKLCGFAKEKSKEDKIITYPETDYLYTATIKQNYRTFELNLNHIYCKKIKGISSNICECPLEKIFEVFEYFENDFYKRTEIKIHPHNWYVTRLDVCKTIEVDYKPEIYTQSVLSKINALNLVRSITQDETAYFRNGTMEICFYNKNKQHIKKYHKRLKNLGFLCNYIRGEIWANNRKSNNSVLRVWKLKKLSDLLSAKTIESLPLIFSEILMERIFDEEDFCEDKDIVLDGRKRGTSNKLLKRNPVLASIYKKGNIQELMDEFPCEGSYKKFLMEQGYSQSYSKIKAEKEYPVLSNLYNDSQKNKSVNARDLFLELKSKFTKI